MPLLGGDGWGHVRSVTAGLPASASPQNPAGKQCAHGDVLAQGRLGFHWGCCCSKCGLGVLSVLPGRRAGRIENVQHRPFLHRAQALFLATAHLLGVNNY